MTSIHWFRKGLRLHDNPCLLECLEKFNDSYLELRPIFILDPNIPKTLKVGPNRWRFLVETLNDLDANLKKLNSRLLVVKGIPEEVFPKLFKEWDVKLLTFESDIEPYSIVRDGQVLKLAEEYKVKVLQKPTHTLFDPQQIIIENFGSPPVSYQRFKACFDSLGIPAKPLESPTTLPRECQLSDGVYNDSYQPPTLDDLGVDKTLLGPHLYLGGETEALRRMEEKLSDKMWVKKFEKPNTSPNSLEPSTTVLSPYLKFGCLSARLFYHKLREITLNTIHSKPPVSLYGQLLWREFYYTAAAGTPNFDRMEGNQICYQIPWKEDKEHLEAWTYGRTGYPFIDAIMRQLRQEGWIHHLARHAVACFLTRGDLWISWEEGQKVFEELLIDADWALNAGNWLWLSASAFFYQFFKVYSPVAFGKKTDPNGDYIRKYVPELKDIPSQYLYEPWTAPLVVQKEAGCIIGEHYPRRIVKHEIVVKKNIKKMSDAYKKNKGVKLARQTQSLNMKSPPKKKAKKK